jgi:hypothetical protein
MNMACEFCRERVHERRMALHKKHCKMARQALKVRLMQNQQVTEDPPAKTKGKKK